MKRTPRWIELLIGVRKRKRLECFDMNTQKKHLAQLVMKISSRVAIQTLINKKNKKKRSYNDLLLD
jgi:hypothetical protein